MGTVYWVKRNGPSTETWGTPNLSGLFLDDMPWLLPDWYRFSQVRGEPFVGSPSHTNMG